MRARLRAVGWDAELAIERDAPRPEPGAGEILVEVEACGVCGRDCIDRAGRFAFVQLPVTPGHEAVGRVVAIGADVADWRIGERVATMHHDACGDCLACAAGETSLCPHTASVLGLLTDGGYARWLCAPASAFYRIHDAIDPALAAVFHCTLGTAYRGLTRARVRAGARVLVTGANGGVGAAAIQVARRLGATVAAQVRRAEHAALAAELGANEVIVDDGATIHKQLARPCDVALDCVGAPTWNASLRALVVGGRLVSIGNVVEARVELNLGYLISFGLQVTGSSGATRADMAALLALHARAPFTVPIQARLPLAEADRAQRLVRAGGLAGRVVLFPGLRSDAA
jgi:D-arabinose 1-dehydrogenase-like Zn-dependent alcohol dehydrogenase